MRWERPMRSPGQQRRVLWILMAALGAADHDVCFIHPKGNPDAPVGGQGVLIELVQAPEEVLAAWRAAASE